MTCDGLKHRLCSFLGGGEKVWTRLPSVVSTLLPSPFLLCLCTKRQTPLSHSCKDTASFFSIGAQVMPLAGTGSPRCVHSWKLHLCIWCHVLWVSPFTPLLPLFFFLCHSSWNFFKSSQLLALHLLQKWLYAR